MTAHLARKAQRGIALPAMVFLVVMLGLMLSAGMVLLQQSQLAHGLQVNAARAMSAAKSAAEWGLWQVNDPTGALGLPANTLPPCFASQTLSLPSPLNDLQVQVSCTREPAAGSVDEGGLKLASYRILAEVTLGVVGSPDFVSRKHEARDTVCKNPGGTAPLYAC